MHLKLLDLLHSEHGTVGGLASCDWMLLETCLRQYRLLFACKSQSQLLV